MKINAEKVYNPAKHCVFCSDGGFSFNPSLKVSSSENGRAKFKQVNVYNVHHLYNDLSMLQQC